MVVISDFFNLVQIIRILNLFFCERAPSIMLFGMV